MNSFPERPPTTAAQAGFDSFPTESAKGFSDPMVSNRAFAIFFIVTMIIVALLLLAPKAGAANNAENDYTGSSTGSLLTSTNWSLGHVPIVSEDATFTATTGIRTLTAGTLTVGSFDVKAGTGTFSIRNETTTSTNSTL